MTVKFVQKIIERQKLTTYALAKLIGVSTQLVDRWAGKTKIAAKGMQLDSLCKIRRIDGRSWNEFGAELDKEFLGRWEPPEE